MTKKLASVFERIAKLLDASGRGRALQRHGDLAHQFALVAPLGGAAMVALQALYLSENDKGWLRLFGCSRCSEGMGRLVADLTVCLSLAQGFSSTSDS